MTSLRRLARVCTLATLLCPAMSHVAWASHVRSETFHWEKVLPDPSPTQNKGSGHVPGRLPLVVSVANLWPGRSVRVWSERRRLRR
jgi:hypothetical protein